MLPLLPLLPVIAKTSPSSPHDPPPRPPTAIAALLPPFCPSFRLCNLCWRPPRNCVELPPRNLGARHIQRRLTPSLPPHAQSSPPPHLPLSPNPLTSLSPQVPSVPAVQVSPEVQVFVMGAHQLPRRSATPIGAGEFCSSISATLSRQPLVRVLTVWRSSEAMRGAGPKANDTASAAVLPTVRSSGGAIIVLSFTHARSEKSPFCSPSSTFLELAVCGVSCSGVWWARIHEVCVVAGWLFFDRSPPILSG